MAVLLCLLAALPASGRDLLLVERPLVAPETERDRVEALLERGLAAANRAYGQWLRAEPAPGAAEPRDAARWRVRVVASLEGSPSLVLTLGPDGGAGEERSFALLEAPGPGTADYLARALFALWASRQAQWREPAGPPPLLLDELPIDALARSVLPAAGAAAWPPSALTPLGAAVTPRGTLVLALGPAAVELDGAFRLVSIPAPLDEEAPGYAHTAAVTPAGTLFLKAAMGGELHRFSPGAERPARVRLRGTPYGPLAALADGSVVLLNTLDRRAWRVEAEGVRELALGAGAGAWPTAMAAGPEGTLWVYYPAERRLRIHASTGELLDSVVPLMDFDRPLEGTALAVHPDGRFVLGGREALWGFDRLGRPLWKLAGLPAPGPGSESEPLPQAFALAVDPRGGVLWLADTLGRRLLKLWDGGAAAAGADARAGAASLEAGIAALNARQRAAPRDPEPTAAKARLYEAAGALEMALLQWERVREIDPRHGEAGGKAADLDRRIGLAAAVAVAERTRRVLEEVGPETARRHYQEALRLFEGHLARHPQDGEARRRQEELRRRFEARPQEDPAGGTLAVDHVEAEDLFPALLDQYHRRPAVRLTVRNTGGQPLREVRAALSVRDYLDFPSESAPVAALGPGASAVLELQVPLNRRVLELEESLPVQGQVELSWRGGDAGGEVRSRRVTVGFTLHRRTALRWDDTGRLASFITPNEGVVATFALRAADASPPPPAFRLSARLLRAALVCDALGTHGLRYVEDPDSPLTGALGGRDVVDTVRFPRETLRLRSGDCDDTTALLASLLEAAGIRTAVMTSPGHVFLAFESGESAAWLLEGSDRRVIRHGDGAWIPVETTVLSQGFLRAWQEASRLVREHEGQGRIEFLPLGGLRERYPPIPLAESLLAAAEPDAAQTAALHERTLGDLLAALHDGPSRALEAGLATARGAEALRLRNRLGILHALFGRDELAERSFQEALEAQPAFLPAACNLANLKLLRGELEAAERVLQRAIERDPQSTAVHLLLARLHQRRQDPVRAREHWRLVQRRDPPLAERYAYLGDGAPAPAAGAAGAARAGATEPELPFVE